MKSISITLFAATVTTAIAAAAPQYLVESSVVTRNTKGTDKLTAPRVVVANGQQATIQIGDAIKYGVTPEVRGNGAVDLRVVLIEPTNTKEAEKLTGLRVTTKLGKEATCRIGTREFTTKTSVAK
jgi:hypothetical protein